MGQFRSIDIDFDVHQVIELERRSFEEKANDALRRLLKIDKNTPASPVPLPANPTGRSWSSEGVVLPHGTDLRMQYNGVQIIGQIDNGKWLVDGKQFTSPSGAASGTARTKSGEHTKLDGWIYWECKRPGDDSWTKISTLRASAT